jgi:archaeosine-15-forming tRNA-guanine transglycosylase
MNVNSLKKKKKVNIRARITVYGAAADVTKRSKVVFRKFVIALPRGR